MSAPHGTPRRRLRQLVDDHGDALAVFAVLVALGGAFVGLLWATQGQVEHVLRNASGAV